MSDNFDSKGVRHSTEWDRDRANEGYVREERDARDKQTELLQQQAELQTEQLRLAERQKLQQDLHNLEMKGLAILKAEEEARHREFTKDIQWLERCDAKGRFDYLFKKARGRVVEALAECVLAESGLVSSKMVAQRRRELEPPLAQFWEANRAYTETSAELDLINKDLASAKKAATRDQGIMLGCLGVGGVIVCLLIIVGLFYDKTANIGAGICFLAIACVVILAIFTASSSKLKEAKESVAKQAELTPRLPKVQTKLNSLQPEREIARITAQKACREWGTDTAAGLSKGLEAAIGAGTLAARLSEVVGEIEQEYPPLVRIDWAALDLAILDQQARALAEEALASALRRFASPSALLNLLKLSGAVELSSNLMNNPALRKAMFGTSSDEIFVSASSDADAVGVSAGPAQGHSGRLTNIPANCIQVAFKPAQGRLIAALTEEHFTQAAAYFLAIRTRIDPRALAAYVVDPDRFKFMPLSLADRAIRGIGLKEEAHPPIELPDSSNLYFFRLEQSVSPLMWQQVQIDRAAAIRWRTTELDWSDASFTLYMTVPTTKLNRGNGVSPTY